MAGITNKSITLMIILLLISSFLAYSIIDPYFNGVSDVNLSPGFVNSFTLNAIVVVAACAIVGGLYFFFGGGGCARSSKVGDAIVAPAIPPNPIDYSMECCRLAEDIMANQLPPETDSCITFCALLSAGQCLEDCVVALAFAPDFCRCGEVIEN